MRQKQSTVFHANLVQKVESQFLHFVHCAKNSDDVESLANVVNAFEGHDHDADDDGVVLHKKGIFCKYPATNFIDNGITFGFIDNLPEADGSGGK